MSNSLAFGLTGHFVWFHFTSIMEFLWIYDFNILLVIAPRTDVEDETPVLWPTDAKNWLIGKDPDVGKDWMWEEKGRTEDEMVGWHHWLNGHEFEQALGVGDEQESLMCCRPWGSQRVRHDWATELNWQNFKKCLIFHIHTKTCTRVLNSTVYK